MKKHLCLLALGALLLFPFTNQNSFAQQIQKGNILINAGVGFGYYYAGGTSFNLNGEYSITDDIGIGPYFSYTRWNHDAYGVDVDYTFIDFGARGSYHFGKLLKVKNEKFDPYAGAFLGFVTSSYDADYDGYEYDDDDYDGGIRTGIHAGARYFFTDQFAGYGEVGIGLSSLIIGFTFKI